jgi:solute carrier family 35 protein C2
MVSESGLSDDEETGLTSKERSERRRRKKRRTHLDARIAEDLDLKVSKEEKKLADVSVVRRLLVDAALIGSWYEFSR